MSHSLRYVSGNREHSQGHQNPAFAGFLNAVGSGVEPRAGKDTEWVSAIAPTKGEYLPATYHNDIINDIIIDAKKNNNPFDKAAIFGAFEHIVPMTDTQCQYNRLRIVVKSKGVDN